MLESINEKGNGQARRTAICLGCHGSAKRLLRHYLSKK
jgi:hypothetical protein